MSESGQPFLQASEASFEKQSSFDVPVERPLSIRKRYFWVWVLVAATLLIATSAGIATYFTAPAISLAVPVSSNASAATSSGLTCNDGKAILAQSQTRLTKLNDNAPKFLTAYDNAQKLEKQLQDLEKKVSGLRANLEKAKSQFETIKNLIQVIKPLAFGVFQKALIPLEKITSTLKNGIDNVEPKVKSAEKAISMAKNATTTVVKRLKDFQTATIVLNKIPRGEDLILTRLNSAFTAVSKKLAGQCQSPATLNTCNNLRASAFLAIDPVLLYSSEAIGAFGELDRRIREVADMVAKLPNLDAVTEAIKRIQEGISKVVDPIRQVLDTKMCWVNNVYTHAAFLPQVRACPSHMHDDGTSCWLHTYGRGGGYAFWDAWRCDREHGQGCEWWGGMKYPRCKPNYHNVGCCLCEPNGGPGIKVTLFERQYCKPEDYKYGALCAGRCPNGFDNALGAGVCWPVGGNLKIGSTSDCPSVCGGNCKTLTDVFYGARDVMKVLNDILKPLNDLVDRILDPIFNFRIDLGINMPDINLSLPNFDFKLPQLDLPTLNICAEYVSVLVKQECLDVEISAAVSSICV
ncbi:hypothetical protein BDR26DRAFT_1008450 [Obelidium mucronatum]|nr:hypothetical protein BDR26DRAFT_1008450 [Obelidium mucronatum]